MSRDCSLASDLVKAYPMIIADGSTSDHHDKERSGLIELEAFFISRILILTPFREFLPVHPPVHPSARYWALGPGPSTWAT